MGNYKFAEEADIKEFILKCKEDVQKDIKNILGEDGKINADYYREKEMIDERNNIFAIGVVSEDSDSLDNKNVNYNKNGLYNYLTEKVNSGINRIAEYYKKEVYDLIRLCFSRRLNELFEEIKEAKRELKELRELKEDKNINLYNEFASMNFKERRDIYDTLYYSIKGLGILEKIMNDKSISEIMINGADNIFVERSGHIEKYDGKFESEQELERIIHRFTDENNKEISVMNPIVDTRMKERKNDNMMRVNIIIPPISLKGAIVTIRRFPEKSYSIEDLIVHGSVTREAANFLKILVEAGYNIFVCGGTGSGKTTFLNILSNYIPKDERVITIEDTAELKLKEVKNLVSLETRNGNNEGKNEISIRDLVRASLRMRPDRIVVGEVRGAETLDMLQAMNTGHDGSLSTGHANSPLDMLSRLETLVISDSGSNMPLEAVRRQIISAIDIIVYLSRFPDKSRKVERISEIKKTQDNKYELNDLFVFIEDREKSRKEKIAGTLKRIQENKITRNEKLIRFGITKDL